MEVQAMHHLNHFLPQIFSSREIAATENNVHSSANAWSTPATAYGNEATAMTATLPTYGFPTCTNPRKRQRDYDYSCVDDGSYGYYNASPPLFGDDVVLQIHQQQLDIDRFVSQHAEKVRIEIEERRSRYSKLIAQAVEQSIAKKLKAREEELIRICRLNLDLGERVKSLTAENQLWRDAAQAADALRRNLEQELAQRQRHGAHLRSESESCGSSNDCHAGEAEQANAGGSRLCRRCEAEEPCVLVLPCRHLCLCAACESSMRTCPVCSTIKTATVHVNI